MPIFFAYEDGAQIIRLIVETYNRLAATINADEHPVSAKMLWEKTTAIMTDSVSKNLKIGEGAAKILQSLYVPYHLLCKSHPVEGFHWSNLSVLARGKRTRISGEASNHEPSCEVISPWQDQHC